MALRIRTQAGRFCSSCGVAAEAAIDLCIGCGQPFESDVIGFVCSLCGHAVEATAERCPMCNLELPHAPPEAGRSLPPPIGPMLQAAPERSAPAADPVGEGTTKVQTAPAEKRDEVATLPEESDAQLLAELESLWKLSEPFEQVVASRRKRQIGRAHV